MGSQSLKSHNLAAAAWFELEALLEGTLPALQQRVWEDTEHTQTP